MNLITKASLLWLLMGGTAIATPRISAKEAAEKIKSEGAVLLDVREESELRESGIAAPALWLAKSEIDHNSAKYQAFMAGRDKKVPVVIYCASGRRAGLVGDLFKELGFIVYNAGGLSDWRAAGLPVKLFDGGA